ncbi:MAG: hypothetical protein KGM15_00755, partial [Pseudomonadota bacterium]|nr:hypothetical protein [Pseudomonadota bacterium]
IAVALVTALTVALVAPPFIDWTARRDMVARAIAMRIGTPVRISGPVTLRLLPTPYLKLNDVAIGPRDAPWLQGPAMRFEFSLTSLLGARIRLDDVSFERPRIRVGPKFAPPEGSPLEFEHIRVSHGDLSVARDGAAALVARDFSFDGSAASTRGPFRGHGDFALDDSRANFQIAAETFVGDALPLKAEIETVAARADFDGRLILDQAPAFAGAATIAGEATGPDGDAWPWRIACDATAGGDEARCENAEVRLGADARALETRGRLALRFGGRPEIEAELKAKTFNIDSLLRKDKETFASPARAVAVFASLAGRGLRRDAPLAKFSLRLSGGVAYLGARSLDAPKLELSGAPDGEMALKWESGLPGAGHIALDGALELGAAPIFRGHGQGKVGDFASLAAWIAEGSPALGQRLAALGAALPTGDITAAADLDLSPQGFSARNLALGVAASRFDGSVVYRLSEDVSRSRLYIDLASDALDIEVAPNVEAGLAWLGDADLDFRLKANTLRVARVGLASVQGGSLDIRARKDGAKFVLEKLSLADLGGASIRAEGETSPAGRWTRVRLDAGRLDDFAALLARAAPSPLTRWLLARADALGAAKATFEARRDGPPLDGPFGLDFLKGDGEIAGARFGLTLSRAPAPVDAIAAHATLDAPDAGALLRRLGANLPAGAAGRAELSLDGSGQWERGFEAKAKLALAGADLAWSGALKPQAEGEAPLLAGRLTLKSGDLFPALAALGLGAAGTGVMAPADLAAEAQLRESGAHFTQIAGALAGARLSGALDWTPRRETLSLDRLLATAQGADAAQPPAPTLTGALEIDHASLAGLLALALGRPAPPRPGALWSEAAFAPALLSPPSLDLGLKIGALDLGAGIGRSASARLQMARDRLTLDDVALLLNGGAAGGRLTLRRDKTQATASGALTLKDVGLEKAGMRGRFDASLDFGGAGGSAAALIAGLSGGGRLTLDEAKIARLDADGFGRALDRIEQGGAALDEKKLQAQIGAELDKAPLTLAGVSAALALSSGALRFGPFEAPARDGSASVSGALDLADLSLGLEAKLVHSKVGPFWSGPPPAVDVSTKGDAATRKIDATLLAAGLAAESLARESDRIANFEADIRERAAFNRSRKAQLFLTRRANEIAAFEAAQEQQRLMQLYLCPYAEWAASRREAPLAPPASGARRQAAQ